MCDRSSNTVRLAGLIFTLVIKTHEQSITKRKAVSNCVHQQVNIHLKTNVLMQWHLSGIIEHQQNINVASAATSDLPYEAVFYSWGSVTVMMYHSLPQMSETCHVAELLKSILGLPDYKHNVSITEYRFRSVTKQLSAPHVLWQSHRSQDLKFPFWSDTM